MRSAPQLQTRRAKDRLEIGSRQLHLGLLIYGQLEESLAQKEAVEKAAIEVERIHGPVLLASGHDDEMCPAEEMGDAICSRLKEKEFRYKYGHIKYKDAGHTLDERWMMGGTFEGNKKARIDLTERMLVFLKAFDSK